MRYTMAIPEIIARYDYILHDKGHPPPLRVLMVQDELAEIGIDMDASALIDLTDYVGVYDSGEDTHAYLDHNYPYFSGYRLYDGVFGIKI